MVMRKSVYYKHHNRLFSITLRLEVIMGQKYDDEKAAEFYADPANRSSAGRKPTRRKAQGLTTHVPIRFRPESIEAIKRLAHEDGMTVSGWVRLLCEREIEARTPSWPFTNSFR